MRKYITLCFFLLTFTTGSVFGADSTLDKIEKSLYGYTYSDESNQSRLNRIEAEVYGATSKDSEQKRIAK